MLPQDGEESSERERERNLINETLGGKGWVKVYLERDGVEEVWERRGDEREVIKIHLEDGDEDEISIDAAQQRFRARAFYQKQLSTLVTDRRTAADQITGIAAAESVDQRRHADQEINAAKREIQSSFQRLIEFWVAQGEHKQHLTNIADLRRRIDAVRKRLEDSGLSEPDQKLIADSSIYSSIETLSAEASVSIAGDTQVLRELKDELPSIDLEQWPDAEGFEEVERFKTSVKRARANLQAKIEDAIAELLKLGNDYSTFSGVFKGRKEKFDQEHKAAVERQANLKGLLEESARLSKELQSAEAAERRGAARLKELGDAPELLSNARSQLEEKSRTRRGILEEASARVEAMSAGSLKAYVVHEDIPLDYVRSLNALCEGNRIRDLQTRCEDRVKAALDHATEGDWAALVDAIMDAYRHKLQTNATSIEPSDSVGVTLTGALWDSLTHQQLSGIYTKLEPSTISGMLIATKTDYISFEYKDADDFIPFAQASPGQQASALLHLLLNQEAGTLIIDQPEDDLDNKVIMKIVSLIQKTKHHRQLIFATHNPNFVVNGDADKIVCLSPGLPSEEEQTEGGARVNIDVDGAIETPSVRDAITDTMEGGQAAFDLRRRKYLF
jgi:cytochrome c556